MHSLDKIEWEILNATADDWENLEQIYRLIHAARPAKITPLLEEIADGIQALVRRGLLAARRGDDGKPVENLADLTYIWRAWFQMTPEGHATWAASEHAVVED